MCKCDIAGITRFAITSMIRGEQNMSSYADSMGLASGQSVSETLA